MVFVPRTTAGVTINENADPDVVYDLLTYSAGHFLRAGATSIWRAIPMRMPGLQIGSSCTVIIENGQLRLGTWQIYFCEFDGPRTRKVYVKLIQG